MSNKYQNTTNNTRNSTSNENIYSKLKDYVRSKSNDSLLDDFDWDVGFPHFTSTTSVQDYFADNNMLEDNGRISLAYENLQLIPKPITEKYAAKTSCLDLSYNSFQGLTFLGGFPNLHTLILDRNYNLNVNSLPFIPSLRILWINNCDITHIDHWIHRIQSQCPNLEQLSLMGNPGTRSRGQMDQQNREYIVSMLPSLKYLNGQLLEKCEIQSNGLHTPVTGVPVTTGTVKSNLKDEEQRKKSISILKFVDLLQSKRSKSRF